jgi:hypothetical protein
MWRVGNVGAPVRIRNKMTDPPHLPTPYIPALSKNASLIRPQAKLRAEAFAAG